MVCRHSPGDPSCGANSRSYASAPVTPDASVFEIVEAERVGLNLVLKVRYPNCRSCAFEGEKVMVFLDVPELAAMKWKKIDPHFRNPRGSLAREAPSPAARFPASPDGWSDALAYARGKSK